jgi:hypothetical protein
MEATWPEKVVARLRQHRAEGCTFEHAWIQTMRALPTGGNGAAFAQLRPSGSEQVESMHLFDEAGKPTAVPEVTETLGGFFRRVCEDAFYGTVGPVGSGNGPALRHFCPEMVLELDNAEPARRSTLSVGRVRQAA